MKKVISVIAVSILLVFVVLLTIQNPVMVRFGMFNHFYQVPLPLIIVGSLLLGICVGMMLFIPDVIKKNQLEAREARMTKIEETVKDTPKTLEPKSTQAPGPIKKKGESTLDVKSKKSDSSDPFDDPELDELLKM